MKSADNIILVAVGIVGIIGIIILSIFNKPSNEILDTLVVVFTSWAFGGGVYKIIHQPDTQDVQNMIDDSKEEDTK